jgi:hypothetical protein
MTTMDEASQEALDAFGAMPSTRTLTRDWRRWAVVIGVFAVLLAVVYACIGWARSNLAYEDHWARFVVGFGLPMAIGQIFGMLLKPLTRCSREERARQDAEWNAWKARVDRVIARLGEDRR